jgi:hypothetical protein
LTPSGCTNENFQKLGELIAMGSWGTGLYQNDTAVDVRMVFADLSGRPIDTDTLVAKVFETFGCGKDPTREEDVDIWLALADQLHLYALEHPATMDRARRVITHGEDLAMKRDLDMSPRDLERREQVLAEVLERWAAPHPKPKKRKAPPAAEPFLLEVGDVWAFPTMQNAARPFHAKDADLSRFVPDGWGVFVVADRFHAFDHRACYLFLLALPANGDRPTLEDVRSAPLQECTYRLEGYDQEWVYPMIFEARLAKRKQGLKQWNAELLGTLRIDADKVRDHAPDKLKSKSRYNANDADGLAWLEDDLTVSSFHRTETNARSGLFVQIKPHPSLRVGDFCRSR